MARLGMQVDLALPEGYGLIPEVMDLAKNQAAESGGSFRALNSMDEAFRDADIIYPKSWAPYHVMGCRTELLRTGDLNGLKELEKECLANNARIREWECTGKKMKLTREGKALYLHCLPADISGISCREGEVSAAVSDLYRTPLYKQAGFKPYVVAAMMLANRFENPGEILKQLLENNRKWML